jgi:hypothetical protein
VTPRRAAPCPGGHRRARDGHGSGHDAADDPDQHGAERERRGHERDLEGERIGREVDAEQPGPEQREDDELREEPDQSGDRHRLPGRTAASDDACTHEDRADDRACDNEPDGDPDEEEALGVWSEGPDPGVEEVERHVPRHAVMDRFEQAVRARDGLADEQHEEGDATGKGTREGAGTQTDGGASGRGGARGRRSDLHDDPLYPGIHDGSMTAGAGRGCCSAVSPDARGRMDYYESMHPQRIGDPVGTSPQSGLRARDGYIEAAVVVYLARHWDRAHALSAACRRRSWESARSRSPRLPRSS